MISSVVLMLMLYALQDLGDQLYESYYFNFITAINRSMLEDLAQAAISSQSITQVHKVRR